MLRRRRYGARVTFMGDPRFSQELQLRRLAEHIEAADSEPREVSEDHEAHAVGQICARCARELTADDEVRRTADGGWVHEECPS
jgi:hypothetical protein